ncbi:hypothetical protein [Streptomyces sp. NPDC048737]|uniref:hypothetical protein n=1 Tax=unclassified Streptomyces TaxID=2593676 RepID=UPI003435BB0F
MSVGSLPECATALFDPHRTVLCLAPRTRADWVDDLVAFTRGEVRGESTGVDPAPMFEEVAGELVRESLLPVGKEGAQDLLKLLALGSFYEGLDPSLREPDAARDKCVHELLEAVGDSVEFFTNHGHAEDGEDADFLVSGFHWNSLAITLYDVCLIGVTPERILVAWRFEDA